MAIRVALFDDNKKFRESLSYLIECSQALQLAGAFQDANDVLSRINECNPDVVVMDLEMPGIHGVEALTIIKRKHPNMPVLVQTVFEDDNLVFEAICCGASGYILKNMPAERILSSIIEIYNGGTPMSSSIAKKVLGMLKATQLNKESTNSFQLTPREQEILKLMVKGLSYKMIASSCGISFETVRSHIRNIYDKLHVVTMTEAVVKAVKNNLV